MSLPSIVFTHKNSRIYLNNNRPSQEQVDLFKVFITKQLDEIQSMAKDSNISFTALVGCENIDFEESSVIHCLSGDTGILPTLYDPIIECLDQQFNDIDIFTNEDKD